MAFQSFSDRRLLIRPEQSKMSAEFSNLVVNGGEIVIFTCRISGLDLDAVAEVEVFSGSDPSWTAMGVTQEGMAPLPVFIQDLSNLWKGWEGERFWENLAGDLRITVTNDPSGHALFRFSLVGGGKSEPWWNATTTIRFEAGEEMIRLAEDVRSFFNL